MGEIDRLTTERHALPSLLLMESAAGSAARAIRERLPMDAAAVRVLLLCGRGNNGGDGAALARLLSLQGARADVALFGQFRDTKDDARVNFEALHSLVEASKLIPDPANPNDIGLPLFSGSSGTLTFTECNTHEDWERFLSGQSRCGYDVIVDAIFGTGLTRPLAGLQLEAATYVNGFRETRTGLGGRLPLIVSLDIPSGLDADSAEPIGEAVRADLTVTFTAPKPANVLAPASRFNGELCVADIGSPRALLDESPSRLYLVEPGDAVNWLRRTRYAPGSYKNTHGHALVVAGSRGLAGAAVLCADAAMRSGAGLVTVATPVSALSAVAARVTPEVMTAALDETADGSVSAAAAAHVTRLAGRADVIAIGPGLTSTDEETRQFTRTIVENRTAPVVVDADGLNSLAPWPDGLRGSAELPLVLTPHAGEMRRLVADGDAEAALADRVGAARSFAAEHSLILVLKGERTIIAAPDGRIFVNPTGNAGLGTAGSGDTLTGIIAGFIAQERATMGAQADVLSAVVAAVYVGGLAGDLAAAALGMRTMVASDVREHLGAAVRTLDPEGERPR